MHAQIQPASMPKNGWAAAGATEQHIDVTVVAPVNGSGRQRLIEELSGVDGVLHVEAPLPGSDAEVPAEMQVFARHLWEVL